MNHNCRDYSNCEKGEALTICENCKTDFFENYFGLLQQYNDFDCQFCLEEIKNGKKEVRNTDKETLQCHKTCWQQFLNDAFGYTVYRVKLLTETSHHEDYCTDDECEYEAKDNIHLFVTKSDKPLSSKDFIIPRETYRPDSYFCTNSIVSKFKGLDKHQIRYTLAAYRKIYPRDKDGYEQYEWTNVEDFNNSVIYEMKDINNFFLKKNVVNSDP